MPTTNQHHYVYLLTSLSNSSHHYTGMTSDLHARLAIHNSGGCPHTAKFRPWQIETALSFRCPQKAAAFEKYLKTGSGRAFAKRHF